MNQGHRWCDFERLEAVVVGQFREEAGAVHGVSHWRRVEQHGLWLATRTEVDVLVVRLTEASPPECFTLQLNLSAPSWNCPDESSRDMAWA